MFDITMDTVEKGKKQDAEMMVINGQSQWMLAKKCGTFPLVNSQIQACTMALRRLRLRRSSHTGLPFSSAVFRVAQTRHSPHSRS
jgi:hypothetical protein